jgi:murein DD-endopeptidase MepM/ murein hydrolase activator NlpD
MVQLIYLILLLFTIGGCKANQNSDSIISVNNVDIIKKVEIIRRPTLFDRKDTNSRVGKCYKKIDENINYFVEVEPKDTVNQWMLPFTVKNRTDLEQIKVVSPFGTTRTSHLRGHKHSGVDIVPVNIDTGIYIYPVAKGIVCYRRIKDPFSSITIKHKLSDGSYIFTSYIHLKNVYVANGDTVDTNTKIGKLFTHREVRRYRGPFDHLHLEVRKNFDDFGFGSSHCMNNSELDSFFYEPINFLSEKIKLVEINAISLNSEPK